MIRNKTQEILKTISAEFPLMIKNILKHYISEETGRALGKTASAYFQELRKGGLPEDAAVRLVEDYIRGFTNLTHMLSPEKMKRYFKDSNQNTKST